MEDFGPRVYVHRSRFDEFVAAFGKEVAALKVGDPLEPDTDVGGDLIRSGWRRTG